MNLNAANISKLIFYMEGLDDPRFTMMHYFHPRECGTPACAAGHSTRVFALEEGESIMDFVPRIFGKDSDGLLFRASLDKAIKTPQQWALHARKVLAEAGLEVEPNAAEVIPPDDESALSVTPTQPTAAPYNFQAFMERVLEPVNFTVPTRSTQRMKNEN